MATNRIEPHINTTKSLDINKVLVDMKFSTNTIPGTVPQIGLDYIPVLASASYHNGNVSSTQPALPVQLTIPPSFNWMEHQKTIFAEPTLITMSNQFGCGQCYCFNVLSALIDRTSIAARKSCPYMSSTVIMSCGKVQYPLLINGCAGGDPFAVAQFLAQHGTVDSVCESMISWCLENGGCVAGTATSQELNNSMPKCATIAKNPCMICWQGQCLDNTKYTQSAVFKIDSSSIKKVFGIVPIQQDILANGPITATFRVYLSFILGALPPWKFALSKQFTQTNGIYCDIEGKDIYNLGIYQNKPVNETFIGNHTINILGWGTDKVNATILGLSSPQAGTIDVPYWIVRNSWGDWMDKGFIKVAMTNPAYKLNTRLGMDIPITIAPTITFGGALSFKPSIQTIELVRNMQRTTINLNDPDIEELKVLPDNLLNPTPYSSGRISTTFPSTNTNPVSRDLNRQPQSGIEPSNSYTFIVTAIVIIAILLILWLMKVF